VESETPATPDSKNNFSLIVSYRLIRYVTLTSK